MSTKKLDFIPSGVLITIPERFWSEYPGGREAFDKMMEHVDAGRTQWHNTISSEPKHPVDFVYFVFKGKVQLRLTVVKFIKNMNMTFSDGEVARHFKDKNWVVLTGPVMWADRSIPFKGFQGFRYTDFLF